MVVGFRMGNSGNVPAGLLAIIVLGQNIIKNQDKIRSVTRPSDALPPRTRER
ncbi:hypothetical protein WJ971_14790 [Achromobacter xylosoxidans]